MMSAILRDELAAGRYLARTVTDQDLDFTGRLRAALRKRAHLAGDDREAAALLAGARRFHSRVECQDVGLECDAVDHAVDVRDAP